MRTKTRIKREPYKQFMFHFAKRNSIDARTISEDDIKWCLSMINHRNNDIKETKKTCLKLLKIWHPEYLI